MSDFLSADAASNSSSSPSTNNDPQTADISNLAGDRPNPDTGTRAGPEAPLRLVETAFLASTASLIWLVNYYFPLGPLLRVFFPLPIALVYLRWGNRAAWMSALVSGLLLSVLMGPTRSILYVIPFGIMGVALGGLWRRKASWSLSIIVGALIGTVGFFFRFWLLSALVGQDLWVYITVQVTEMVEWAFVKLGWLMVPSLDAIGAIAAGMILVNNIVYLFVVHLVALLLLDRLGNPIPRPPRWVQVLIDYEE
ncbi:MULTISPECIES: DUF2232 domain-containing protein [Microcoleaceae]|uniref:DUF2232 domain-containing protein n=1 Tax=Microcoleaceae TaxID=1892252 RepID=UPI00187F7898|nr:DUF2232 domain-containing protein [Tychonema sp. LEGE 06208]MBE9161989.1 DUF2232 domain-containing protein [Tychonema sp. LEGE 06208]